MILCDTCQVEIDPSDNFGTNGGYEDAYSGDMCLDCYKEFKMKEKK